MLSIVSKPDEQQLIRKAKKTSRELREFQSMCSAATGLCRCHVFVNCRLPFAFFLTSLCKTVEGDQGSAAPFFWLQNPFPRIVQAEKDLRSKSSNTYTTLQAEYAFWEYVILNHTPNSDANRHRCMHNRVCS